MLVKKRVGNSLLSQREFLGKVPRYVRFLEPLPDRGFGGQ
jgi:hypothetical protein